jgi:hypothetical protein
MRRKRRCYPSRSFRITSTTARPTASICSWVNSGDIGKLRAPFQTLESDASIALSAVPRLRIAHSSCPCSPCENPPVIDACYTHVRWNLHIKKAPSDRLRGTETVHGRLTGDAQVATAEDILYPSRCHEGIPGGSGTGDGALDKHTRQSAYEFLRHSPAGGLCPSSSHT